MGLLEAGILSVLHYRISWVLIQCPPHKYICSKDGEYTHTHTHTHSCLFRSALADFLYKKLDSKFFRLRKPDGLFHNYSAMPLSCRSRYRLYIYIYTFFLNGCVPIKLYLQKQVGARFGWGGGL